MMSEEKKPQPLKLEILEKISTLIAASFGFIVAFAWNENFKVLILSGVEAAEKPILLLVYALFVTIIGVLITIVAARAIGKARRSLQ